MDTETSVYNTWMAIKQRCYNPNNKCYKNYGGRGILLCDKWQKFSVFYTDMGERPEGLTLERVDNDGNYEPGNCAWVSQHSQQRNKTNNVWITYNGISMVVADWAIEYNLSPVLLGSRIRRGWNIETALTTPARKYKSCA